MEGVSVETGCLHCGALLSRAPGARGRPSSYCSRECRIQAARLRAASRMIGRGELVPWTGDFERWDVDDADDRWG
jgi:hypothetical protein